MSSKRSISRHIWISAHLGFQAQDSSGQILDLRNIIHVRNIRHIAGLQAHFRFLECLVILSISTSGIPPGTFVFPWISTGHVGSRYNFQHVSQFGSPGIWGLQAHTRSPNTFLRTPTQPPGRFFSPAHLRSPVIVPSAFCPDIGGTVGTHRNSSMSRNIVDTQECIMGRQEHCGRPGISSMSRNLWFKQNSQNLFFDRS